jgi:hypothetical protein
MPGHVGEKKEKLEKEKLEKEKTKHFSSIFQNVCLGCNEKTAILAKTKRKRGKIIEHFSE